MWASEGLIRSKGDVFISTCSPLIGAELRWRKGTLWIDAQNTHPNTVSEGSRREWAQIG